MLHRSVTRADRDAPGDEASLKKADNHWAEIKSRKVTYRIVGMPDRDFLKVPDHREASYTAPVDNVIKAVASYYGLKPSDIKSVATRHAWSCTGGDDPTRAGP
ncbi:MAG: hypothetical protein ACREBE_02305 [bacterium]